MDEGEAYRNLTDVFLNAIQVFLDIPKHLESSRSSRFRSGIHTRTEFNGLDGVEFRSAWRVGHFLCCIRRRIFIVGRGEIRHLVVWRVLCVRFEVHIYFAVIDIIHQVDYKLLVVNLGTGGMWPGTNEAGFYDDVVEAVFQINGDRGHDGCGGRSDTHVSVVSEDLCGPIRNDQLGVIVIIDVDDLLWYGRGAGSIVLVFGLRLRV